MLHAFKDNWALFLGILLLMVSNGLLATLLTIRGVSLGFSEITIGFMQAGYPLGALLGAVAAPKLVEKVGHIRSFGALASLCSISAVVHLLTNDPMSWGLMRVLAGFCYPGLYVISESWLNAKAENRYRASLLSIYFIVIAAGGSIGAAMAGFDDGTGTQLFGICSILISVSLVPILVSDNAAPEYSAPERLPILRLLRISPLAITGSILNGILVAGIFISLPLFGLTLGLSAAGAASLLVVATLAGALFQFPIGWLSDRIDRRLVVAGASGIAALTALGIASGLLAGQLHLAVGLMAGMLLPIYSICVAHANDQLSPAQIVPASGTLVLALNVGILIGSMVGPAVLSVGGPTGLMLLFVLVSCLTVFVAIFRITQSAAPEESRAAQAISSQGGQMAGELHPEAEQQQ
ncbi:MFS transporter [Parasedimentitalea marina]|uniref:MFS transporter n=1 Tax=Parasedimentitalea marina TaxID=2483033 RepID=A0A3T0N6S7_9RHOB|nr:MFS transporter [Parasedimentitalea marina]AZV79753.1 MFS transporter [Parasedimentitalea marina]